MKACTKKAAILLLNMRLESIPACVWVEFVTDFVGRLEKKKTNKKGGVTRP